MVQGRADDARPRLTRGRAGRGDGHPVRRGTQDPHQGRDDPRWQPAGVGGRQSSGYFRSHHGRISLVDRGGTRRTLVDRLPAGLDLDNGGSSAPPACGWPTVTRSTSRSGSATSPSATPHGARCRTRRACRRHFSARCGASASARRSTTSSTASRSTRRRTTQASPTAVKSGWGTPRGRARVRVLADFRDIYPGTPPNPVSASNPFGLLLLEDHFYLPDAGQNSLVRIDRETGRIRTIVHFSPVATRPPSSGRPSASPCPTASGSSRTDRRS